MIVPVATLVNVPTHVKYKGGQIKIQCDCSQLVAPKDLFPHPQNPNKHTKEQIERLSNIIVYQGFRNPIKVSRYSNYITSGHGRLAAAIYLEMESVPVD